MTKLEAFELRGEWDNDGLAWLDGKRAPEFDIINEHGMTSENATREVRTYSPSHGATYGRIKTRDQWDCQECCEHHNPASPCP